MKANKRNQFIPPYLFGEGENRDLIVNGVFANLLSCDDSEACVYVYDEYDGEYWPNILDLTA